MTLIFWQNIVSPHQRPYIQDLAKSNSKIQVVLVAAEEMSTVRKKMGWSNEKIEEREKFEIILSPSKDIIQFIFKHYPNAHHFFSGLRSNLMVFSAFKYSLNHNVKRHLITEGPTFYRRPKFLHFLRTAFLDRKYFKRIDKIFAIGNDAQYWYRLWGFRLNNIIPFLYCVESHNRNGLIKANDQPTLKLLFVGRLIKLKGIKRLLNQLSLLQTNVQLDIIGDGKEMGNLKKIAIANKINNKVNFIGSKSNHEIRNTMADYDCLILPSLYDGWGAVVNEALMSGLFVICSNQCGAKELINEWNGIIFSHMIKNNLFHALTYCSNNRDLIRSRKNRIKEWSKCIEAESISKYFLDSLTSEQKIIPPWKKD
jgi:glycosyltransferase involved in cell wall biosynthesis